MRNVKILLTAFVLLANSLIGQNLINNPSFEHGICPRTYSLKQIDFQVTSWYAPDKSTPDYYHKCADKDVGIPMNWAGIQTPIEGDGFVGIYLKKGTKYQENIGVTFSSPLVKDTIYEVSFYLANAAYSEYLACEISVLITENPISINLTEMFEFREHTLKVPLMKDLSQFQWQKISFSYKAYGGERFFYIGSLTSDTDFCYKNISRLGQEPMLDNSIYVYLDGFEFHQKILPKELISEPKFQSVEDISSVTLYFDFDEFYLSEKSTTVLDTLVQFVNKNDLHLLITGATDSLGAHQYNFDLGSKRALAVKDYLTFAGISPLHIKAVSKGEETPNYPNDTETVRMLNRNVLIEFFRKDATN